MAFADFRNGSVHPTYVSPDAFSVRCFRGIGRAIRQHQGRRSGVTISSGWDEPPATPLHTQPHQTLVCHGPCHQTVTASNPR